MRFLTAAWKIAAFLTVLSVAAQSLQAQQTADLGAATGTDTGAAQSDAAPSTLSTEVDMSAFSEIERGETIGDTGGTGFGLDDEGGNQTGVGGIGGGGLGAFGGLGGFGGLSNLFGGGLRQAAPTAKPIIRTRIRSAVRVAPMAPTYVQREAAVRLNQVRSERQLGGVNVQMVGRTAVLTGTVSTESDRRMSELLLRLEPGVSNVQNSLVVLPQ